MSLVTGTTKGTPLHKRIVVSSGRGHLDIDALACCVAYAQLLRLKGCDSHAIMSPPLNNTVTETIRKWKLGFKRPSEVSDDFFCGASFCVLDLSDPAHLDLFIDHDNVCAVLDHHYGFETYWSERQIYSVVEHVGACATLVYEEFVKERLVAQMDAVCVDLLLTAILSNTLNFKSRVTTQRDLDAYGTLVQMSSLPRCWPDGYFNELTSKAGTDLLGAALGDSKVCRIKGRLFWIAQLELWDINPFHQHILGLRGALSGRDGDELTPFINVVNISGGYNLIICKTSTAVGIFKDLYPGFELTEGIYQTHELYLRKEIIRDLGASC